MIKIDDRYSIVGGKYGFVLQERGTWQTVRTVGYFSDLVSALKGYARQELVRAVGGEKTETSLKELAETIEQVNKTIEAIYR